MRVSEHYALGRSQPTLDFVDVDIVADTPVFISPKALTMLPSEFGDQCVHLVQNFFQFWNSLELGAMTEPSAYFGSFESLTKLAWGCRREKRVDTRLAAAPLMMSGKRLAGAKPRRVAYWRTWKIPY
jgi:hypothetical protein